MTKLSDYSCIVRPHYKVLLQNTLQRWIFIHSAGIISKEMRPKHNTFSPVLVRTRDFTVQARSQPYNETFRIYKEHNHWQEAGFTVHSQFEPLSPQTPTLSSKIYIFVCIQNNKEISIIVKSSSTWHSTVGKEKKSGANTIIEPNMWLILSYGWSEDSITAFRAYFLSKKLELLFLLLIPCDKNSRAVSRIFAWCWSDFIAGCISNFKPPSGARSRFADSVCLSISSNKL